MAIKFKGDTTVAIINSIKKAEVDTVYRCFDSGVLLSNEVINHGDFVSWDGTKWIKRSDLSYLIDNVAAPIDQQIMSNIAPAYVKQPYPANSYVTKDGVLYTNAAAIDTAEDWTPAHWIQTTVADMIADAGGAKWTNRTTSVSVAVGTIERVDVQDHEFVNLTVTRTGINANSTLELHLHGECYVHLVKMAYVRVLPVVGDAPPTNRIDCGIPSLAKVECTGVVVEGCTLPEEYSADAFTSTNVLEACTSIIMDQGSSPEELDAVRLLLHYLGEGTLIITQLP